MSLPTETLWKYAGEAMEAMFSGGSATQFDQGDFGWIMATGEPVADFNCAYVASGGNEGKRLEKFVKQFEKLGCPFLICAPQVLALKLHLTAQKLGLRPIGELPVMTISPSSFADWTPGPLVQVEKISTAEELSVAVAIGSVSFGIRPDILANVVNMGVLSHPRISMYAASYDESPAAIVTVTRHEDAIGIWSMVTLPEYRRKGVASHLVKSLLREEEVSTCFLLSTDEGRRLYSKLGFTVQAKGQVWCGGV